MTYKIVKCPNCKVFSMTLAEVSFKCINCSKTFDITRLKIYFSNNNPQIVTKTLQKIKQEQHIQRYGDEKINDFF